MKNKQTAVDFIISKLSITFQTMYSKEIEQAKEMEKEQMKYSEEEVISYAKYFASHGKAANFAKPLKPSEWYSL